MNALSFSMIEEYEKVNIMNGEKYVFKRGTEKKL